MTVKKKIVSLSLTLVVLLFITGMLQFRSIMDIAGNWQQYQRTALARQTQLTEIKSQFGYGGFIHNFKNHVLRGTEKYAARFKKNKADMDRAFAAYKELDLSSEEGEALTAIQTVADQYRKAVDTSIAMHKAGSDPIAIDKAVKIDDSPSFTAFKLLDDHVLALEKSAGESLNKTIKSILTLMMITSVAMVLFFMLFFQVLRGGGKRFALLHHATVEIGKGNLSAPLEVGGNDEISSIAPLAKYLKMSLRQLRA